MSFGKWHPWLAIAHAIWRLHYNDVLMSAMASQITSLTIVYSTVYSGADKRKHQRSASLAFVRGIHRWPVNSPHKGPVTQNMFPFNDVIMLCRSFSICDKKYWTIRSACENAKSVAADVPFKIQRLRDFMRSCGKTSVHLVNRGSGSNSITADPSILATR